MRAIALVFPLALFVVSPGHAQPPSESYVWGPTTNGLRVGISVQSSGQPNGGARFSIAFENTGGADFVLNLAYMLANGKVMFPSAVELTLASADGTSRDLRFFDRPIAGRMDAYTVALRTGSLYIVRTSLDQYYATATNNFHVVMPAGTSRIAARLTGMTPTVSNGDMTGVSLLNFWTGSVQSGFAEFQR